ncbi:MAG: helix-turn-helix domain-containing protein [Rhodospirillaceae bacterium]
MARYEWWRGHEAKLLERYAPVRNIDIASSVGVISTEVATSTNLKETQEALGKFCRSIGAEMAVCLRTFDKGDKIENMPCVAYKMEAYTSSYIDSHMVYNDAISFACRHQVLPIPYGLSRQYNDITPEERKHIDFRESWGMKLGMLVPFHGQNSYGILCLKFLDTEADFLARLPVLSGQVQIFGTGLHDAMRRFSPIFNKVTNDDYGNIRLTNRETECLLWAAAGKTGWETSCILGVSRDTVVFHIENAKKKLRSKTLPQAVARAIVLGLLNI